MLLKSLIHLPWAYGIPKFLLMNVLYGFNDIKQDKLIEAEWHIGALMSIKHAIIGSDNGLSPVCPKAIWTNVGFTLIGPFQTYFSETLIKLWIFSMTEVHAICRLQNGTHVVFVSFCQLHLILWLMGKWLWYKQIMTEFVDANMSQQGKQITILRNKANQMFSFAFFMDLVRLPKLTTDVDLLGCSPLALFCIIELQWVTYFSILGIPYNILVGYPHSTHTPWDTWAWHFHGFINHLCFIS